MDISYDCRAPPELIKHQNDQDLKALYEKVYSNYAVGSPEYRKHEMQLRLLRKRNQKEYDNSKINKRRSARFTPAVIGSG